MAKRMTTARKAAALGLAAAVAASGTAGAADLQGELDLSQQKAAAYAAKAKENRRYDGWSGGFLLLSGFYGAAVTAFNPAPKNLKAAILATGTGEGFRQLRFRERAGVYAEGNRAMTCVVTSGSPMTTYEQDHLGRLLRLRATAVAALKYGDLALAGSAEQSAQKSAAAEKAVRDAARKDSLRTRIDLLLTRTEVQAEDSQRKVLEERMETLAKLDAELAAEYGAYDGAPERVAQVRSQVEAAIDARLAAAAPDYSAAVKAMGEIAKPKDDAATKNLADGKTPQQQFVEARDAGQVPTITQALIAVNIAIRDLQAQSPTQARAAFKTLGECIPKAG